MKNSIGGSVASPSVVSHEIHQSVPKRIYRHDLSTNIKGHLQVFALIHKYDSLPDFKEAWNKWTETHVDVLMREQVRLESNGFSGDFNKKIYTAVRYYFRNKQIIVADSKDSATIVNATPIVLSGNGSSGEDKEKNESNTMTITRKKEQQKRRPYISLGKSMLREMDSHIRRERTREDFTPAIGFTLFCEEQYYMIEKMVSEQLKAVKTEDMDGDKECVIEMNLRNDLEQRMKKTYKNRYSLISH